MANVIEVLLRQEGPPTAGGVGGTPTADEQKNEENRDKPDKGWKKHFMDTKASGKSVMGWIRRNMGVQFTVASVLKQSQIFTSTIGVIFQLLGALVDIMLAPLIPVFFPIIKVIAGTFLPFVQKKMEQFSGLLAEVVPAASGWVDNVKQKFEDLKNSNDISFTGITEAIGEGIGSIASSVGTSISDFWTDLDTEIKDRYVRFVGWATSFFAFYGKLTWQGISAFVKSEAPPLIWEVLKGIGKAGMQVIKALWGVVDWLLGKLLGPFWPLIKTIVKFAYKLVAGTIKIMALIIKFGPIKAWKEFIWPYLQKKWTAFKKWVDFDNLMKNFKTMINNIWQSLLKRLQNLPMGIGKAFKGESTLIKGVATTVGKLGGTKGAITSIAKATKGIPVVGALATAGFGAYETYTNWRDYGAMAGLATLGKTAAATTAAGFGLTPLALGLDVGGTVAINKWMKTEEQKKKIAAQGGGFNQENWGLFPSSSLLNLPISQKRTVEQIQPQPKIEIPITINAGGFNTYEALIEELNHRDEVEANLEHELEARGIGSG